MNAKEFKIPVVLLAVGLTSIIAFAFVFGGPYGLLIALLLLTVQTVVGVAILLAACFVAARLLGIYFGPVSTAVLKLTAIFIFICGAAVWLLAWASLYLALAAILGVFLIFYALLAWLFDLEGPEPLLVSLICVATGVAAQLLIGIVIAVVI